MSEWADAFAAFVASHSHWAGALVFLISASEAILVAGMIIPGTAFLLAIGALIGLGHLPLLPILVWAALGAIVGDGFSYWLGHRYQDRLQGRWPFSRYPELIERGKTFFHRHGGKSVCLGRFIPVLKPIVPVVAGILGMPPGRFYTVNVLSAIVWSPAHVLPGVLIGASLGVLHGVSPRLMAAALGVLLALAGLAWGLKLWVTRAAPVVLAAYRRGYTRLRRHYPARPPGWLRGFDPDHPGASAFVSALSVLLGSLTGLAATIEDVLTGDPLVRADRAISHLVTAFRNPWADPVMVGLTSLGDAAVTIPVAITVVAALLVSGTRRLAVGVTLAMAVTGGAVLLLKGLGQIPRPEPLYSGISALAFPSGHTAMSATLYGMIAWLAASARGVCMRATLYALAVTWATAIGLSRIYLGAHWPSDVIGGLLLGALVVSATAAFYGGAPRQPLRGGSLGAAVLLVLAGAGAWHIGQTYRERLALYKPAAATTTRALADWRAGAWRMLPPRRLDLGGGEEEPISLQWAGTAGSLATKLDQSGWKRPPPWTPATAIGFARPDTPLSQLPVLPTLHDGRGPVLMRIRPTPSPGERWVLRVWPSGYRLAQDRTSHPLLLGSVVREKVMHPATMFTRVRREADSPPLDTLSVLLGGRLLRRAGACASILLAEEKPQGPGSPPAPVRSELPARTGCGEKSSRAFFTLGDQGTGDAHQRRVAAAMEATLRAGQGARFVLLLGDNFYPRGIDSPSDPQWADKLESVYRGACLGKLPLYGLLGNHDHRGSIRAQIEYARRRLGSGRWRMPAPHYTIDLPGPAGKPLARIAVVDTEVWTDGDDRRATRQARSVQRAFAGRSSAPIWRVVAGHKPIRSIGRHGDTASLIGALLPVVEAAGVNLYLAGHDHDLELLSAPDEPLYLVSGGGGAKPYRLKGLDRTDLEVHFAEARRGFSRVAFTPDAVEIQLYGEDGTRLYHHRLAPTAAPR